MVAYVPWNHQESYPDSTERLYLAGLLLADAGDTATAGHLYGIATECGIKSVLERASILIDKNGGFRTHVPELIQAVLTSGQTRHMISLLSALSALSSLPSSYTIHSRYAKNETIDSVLAAEWQNEAEQVLMHCGFYI